jgi:excisionase family DNA binding protein
MNKINKIKNVKKYFSGYISTMELAQKLGITKQGVMYLVKEKKIPYYKLNNRYYYFSLDDVENYLKSFKLERC